MAARVEVTHMCSRDREAMMEVMHMPSRETVTKANGVTDCLFLTCQHWRPKSIP